MSPNVPECPRGENALLAKAWPPKQLRIRRTQRWDIAAKQIRLNGQNEPTAIGEQDDIGGRRSAQLAITRLIVKIGSSSASATPPITMPMTRIISGSM